MPKAPVGYLPFMGWNYQKFDLVVSQSTKVLVDDPRRAGVLFAIGWQQPYPAGADFRVSPMTPADDFTGFILNADNPTFIADWQQFGPLLSQAWYAWEGPIGPIGNNYIQVWQWYFDPEPYRGTFNVPTGFAVKPFAPDDRNPIDK